MDKLNKKLIKSLKKIYELEKKDKKTSKKYKYLQDEVHLYFDSKYDTTDAQQFVIKHFWNKAYKLYKDGGYITNDEYISKVRFDYETKKIDKILNKECKKTSRALDIGCGDGRYTKEFAKKFDEVIGIDLSEKRIKQNNKTNSAKNICYINENFITMKKNSLGKFDFVFVGDIFMYTPKRDIKKVFESLLKLLNKDGILIVRESTQIYNEGEWKSKSYVAYYRNRDFYTKGIFKKSFKKYYRNYGYNLYHTNKFFTVFENEKEKIRQNPFKLEKIVKKYIDKYQKSSHFYIYEV
jgi:ubiquinone/menaquinone biosynthesis C-methylase UbiE